MTHPTCYPDGSPTRIGTNPAPTQRIYVRRRELDHHPVIQSLEMFVSPVMQHAIVHPWMTRAAVVRTRHVRRPALRRPAWIMRSDSNLPPTDWNGLIAAVGAHRDHAAF